MNKEPGKSRLQKWGLIIFILIWIPSFYSCRNEQKGKSQEVAVNPKIAQAPVKDEIKNETILGLWKSVGDEILTLEISADSINYAEQEQSFPYELRSDSIFMDLDGLTIGSPILMKGDTLIFDEEGEQSAFVRIRK